MGSRRASCACSPRWVIRTARGRFIHVAGTNGKGSTCAMIALGAARDRITTGLYTSPHLVDPRERIQIDGELDFRRGTGWRRSTEVHDAAEALLAADEIEAHPSFFETVTAMAFLAFARAEVDSGGARNRARRQARRDQCGQAGSGGDYAD